MILDFIRSTPPITVGILFTCAFLSILVHMDEDLVTKMYLIHGREHQYWRYFTNLLFMGQFNLNFLIRMIFK